MKRSKIAGWKDVYQFTLTQTLKSRAFIVSFVLLIVLGLVSMPLMNLITGSMKQEEKYTITKAYVYDGLGVVDEAAMQQALNDAGWEVELVEMNPLEYGSEAYKTLIEEIDKNHTEEIVISAQYGEGTYDILFERSGNGKVESAEINNFGAIFAEKFEEQRVAALGLSAEQKALIDAGVATAVSHVGMTGEVVVEVDTSISDSEYWILYAFIFIIMMICTMAGSQIATSIVTEKSSKVVEYLLTSVRPLAIIVGKVLAMLCVVLTQIISIIVMLVISNMVSTNMSGGESMLAKYLNPEILNSLTVVNIIVCLIMVALGLVFYATLAGLAGATVSKLEEAGEAMTMFTVLVMAGAYMGIGASATLLAGGTNAFTTFVLICPISSPFILPGAILIGRAEIWMIIVAIALLALLIVFLFAFVSRVYEALIVYNGNKVGIKQLIKMSKN